MLRFFFSTYTSHKPYMTISPVNSRLYISDYMNRRIIHVKTMGPVRDLQENFDVVAGSGEECTPGERDLCGDGKPALTARFLHPKGIVLFFFPFLFAVNTLILIYSYAAE